MVPHYSEQKTVDGTVKRRVDQENSCAGRYKSASAARLAGVDRIKSCFLSFPKPSRTRMKLGGQLCLIALGSSTRTPSSGFRHANTIFREVDQAQDRLKLLTARFRNALKKSVEGIIEAGRVLIEAKNELEHGQFGDWVVRDLQFGDPQEGGRQISLRKAQMLMFVAKNEVISNANHWFAFPPAGGRSGS